MLERAWRSGEQVHRPSTILTGDGPIRARGRCRVPAVAGIDRIALQCMSREVEMSQLTVRLPDEMSRALSAAATRMQRKRAEIVRMALRRFLGLNGGERPAARVTSLLGSIESEVPDLAEHHRKYVLESLSREP
jgi:hypothetical protein